MSKFWKHAATIIAALLCATFVFAQAQPPMGGGSAPISGASATFTPGPVQTGAGGYSTDAGFTSTAVAAGPTPFTAPNICLAGSSVLIQGCTAGSAYGLRANSTNQNMQLFNEGATQGVVVSNASDGYPAGLGTPNVLSSKAGSGGNAVAVLTNGARIDYGTGASDYASSDGTTVTFAGLLTGTTSVKSTGDMEIPTNGAYYMNGATHSAYIYYDATNVRIASPAAVTTIMGVTGGGGGAVNIGGTANVNTTGVGNVGASGPDDLQVYTLPANSLVTASRCIKIKAWGTTANNASAKTVRLTIGPTPTVLITKLLTPSIAGFWKIESDVCRTSASNQDFFAEATNYGGTTVSSTDATTTLSLAAVGTLTQTETSTMDIKTQSTLSTSNNDIISEGLTVTYY